MSNAPKTMELRFPCASRSLHLPSILPSVAAASFWLVVALIIINRRPFKAAVYFIFYIFCRSICRPKQWDNVPPRAPPPTCLHSNIPPTASVNYWVDCWLSSSIGGHLRPRPRLPLYFLMSLGLAPQTRQPTAAPPNPTTCTLPKPIGSGGTMTWWCRWPIHGGRGLKPVEGRAAWLMLVVVSCCEDKKTLLEHLIVL